MTLVFLLTVCFFVLFLIPKLWGKFNASIESKFIECSTTFKEIVLLTEATEKRCSKYIQGFTPQAIDKLNLLITIRRTMELLIKSMDEAKNNENHSLFNSLYKIFECRDLSRKEFKEVLLECESDFSALKLWRDNFEFALADVTTELEVRSTENLDLKVPNVRKRNSTITIVKELRDYLVNRF